MNSHYPNLFSPIYIGNVRLKNRIVAAPTGLMSLTPAGHLTTENRAYYERKAQGGVAVVTLGESIVHTATGRSHVRQIPMDDPNVLPSLSETAQAIHRHNCLANIELSHGGMYAGLASVGGERVDSGVKAWGPSAMDVPQGHVYEMPEEMILEIVEAWGDAAATAKRAGFDMCMVHAAHGWLFNQFLKPSLNHRTDRFGGSLENRARFLMMALDNIRKKTGRFPIELRLNGDDFTEGGMHLEEYKELARMVEDKVDLFQISCGSHEEDNLFVRTHPSMFLEHGCNVYLAAEIKKVVKKPVACVGALNDPAMCEEIIASGKADMVEMARALLADPDLPEKARKGQADEIRPCLRCFVCLGECVSSETIRCAVNPEIGNEVDFRMGHPAPARSKRVLVIGGGPAGMEAATVAARRGHQVVLCEKSGHLGGQLHHASAVDFKQDLFAFEQWMERQVRASGAEIRLNTEVTPELVRALNPEALFVTVGAEPLIPPVEGIQSPKVVTAEYAESNPDKLGDHVVVLGGGLVGCEAAITVAKHAKQVTIVEMRGACAADVNPFERTALQIELSRVTQRVNCTARSIGDDGMRITDAEGREELLPADTVICAAGLRANRQQVEALADLVEDAYVIGDARQPRQVTQAVYEAYYTAISL